MPPSYAKIQYTLGIWKLLLICEDVQGSKWNMPWRVQGQDWFYSIKNRDRGIVNHCPIKFQAPTLFSSSTTKYSLIF